MKPRLRKSTGTERGQRCPRPVAFAGLGWATALVFLLAIGAASGFAQTGSQHEYELKAGVLYHIIEYVQWPAQSSPSNQPPPIEIGLLGQIPFANALEVLDGKTLQGRKIVVKRLTDRQ